VTLPVRRKQRRRCSDGLRVKKSGAEFDAPDTANCSLGQVVFCLEFAEMSQKKLVLQHHR
jgi:hypothetical protein